MHADRTTDTELTLVRLWTEILGVDDVGPSDNFFDLGGDSMLATRLVLSARRTWNVRFPVRVLLEAPVLKDLAHRIDVLVAADGHAR